MADDDRLERLRQVKLAALVRDRWGSAGGSPGGGPDGSLDGSARVAGPFAAGATLREADAARGWVLDEVGAVASLGAALVWGRRNAVRELHLLLGEGARARVAEGVAAPVVPGVVARRAGLWAEAPGVWTVAGRELRPVAAAPVPVPIELPAAARAWIPVLEEHGTEVATDHGVITGEILGLEVARVVPDLQGGGWHVEVGVGAHDREARREMHPDEPLGDALGRVVDLVRRLRVAGATRHPANSLARERWLRSIVTAHPELVGAVSLRPVPPPIPRHDLRLPTLAPAVGTAADGTAVVVACSIGVDPDLVPGAADTRYAHEQSIDEPARLLLVVPEGDDYPVTRDLAATLAAPAEVVVVPRDWPALA